jgi:aminomethyltransferase
VPFVLTGRGIPRPGNRMLHRAEPVGEVTSGTHSPSLEVGIGMGYVSAELAEPGTELEIDVRGTRRPARVARKPLYTRERH